jgi:hypothetical protein
MPKFYFCGRIFKITFYERGILMILRHICEVCGKEELLTPEQSHEQGWDYPPKMGQFRVLSPRTCGDCSINQTVWWSVAVDKKQPADLNERQVEALNRILQEPESIMVSGE